MELVDYLGVLRRRWVLVLLATVLCSATAFGYSSLQPASYTTATRLVVSGLTGSGADDEMSLRKLAIDRAIIFTSFANTVPAAAAALATAGYSPTSGHPTVVVTADAVAPFITIVVTDQDPVRAAAVANAYVTSLPTVVARLSKLSSPVASQLSVLEPAVVPVEPGSPKPYRDGAGGLALGLLLGLGAAFLREGVDRTFTTSGAIEQDLGIDVLGVIPQEFDGHDLPTLSHPTSSRAEAYRTVRMNIQFAGPPHTLSRIVITSATQNEGKTTTATNLAVAFARSGQRVVIVDADLRRPRLASVFHLAEAGPGLAGCLENKTTLSDALRMIEPGLAVLPAGKPPENPSELLGSTRMTTLLQELSEQFDVVLIDTPPVLPVADALLLSINATGVVLVTRLDNTTKAQVRRTLVALRQLDVPLLGLVANGSRSDAEGAYHNYLATATQASKPTSLLLARKIRTGRQSLR